VDRRSAVAALPAPTRSDLLRRQVDRARSASGFFTVADEVDA